MSEFFLAAAAGFLAGIFSAWGVGGGTLLLLVMTLFLHVDQQTAQGINLLFFLPAAGTGLLFHHRRGLVDKGAVRQALPWGLLSACAGAWIASAADISVLRKPYGVLLLGIGISVLIRSFSQKK